MPPAREKAFPAASKSVSGPPASGDDFDSVMKAALAPHSQKSPDKNLPRTGKSQPGLGQLSPARPSADADTAATATTSAAEKKFTGKLATDKTDGATGGGEKTAARVDGKISLDLISPLMAKEAAGQAPVLVSPPLTSCSRSLAGSAGDLSLPGKSGAVEEVAAATSRTATTGQIVPAVLPLAESASPATAPLAALTPSGLNAAGEIANPEADPGKTESGKNLLLKSLSPVTAAEAAGLSGELIPGSGKNLSATGLAATPGAENATEMNLDAASLTDGNLASGKMNSPSGVSVERAAENAGTGVATTVSQMKNPQKMNKVAGPDVKVLPVGEPGVAREQNLPPASLTTPARSSDSRSPDLNFSFANGNNGAPVADNAPVLNALDLPSLADARLRALERTHDMMALHSMRLVESKSDVLSVVIKPSVGTELSLELRQCNGGVAAQATLTRGDHQLLSQHWPELQQRLELRGIKLAPLDDGASFSAGDSGSFLQQQASREDAAQRASAFAEFASIRNAGGATARRAPLHEGWESWA